MKRKPAKRIGDLAGTAPVEQPLRYVSDELFRMMHDLTKDEKGRWRSRRRSVVNGIPLPANLDEIALEIGQRESDWFRESLSWVSLSLPDCEFSSLAKQIAGAVQEGFVLALLRYQDDLKHVPEARAVLEANRRNARKGGAARRKQAEPRRQQARRLDRELRKEGGVMKKKTYRVQRIAAEMRVDTRTVERYLSPAK